MSKKTSKREKIKADLMEQLERNGTTGEHYKDLVEDYMKFLEIKDELMKDIQTRGAVVEYKTTAHTIVHKKNDSIAELNKVNDRMLKMLDAIGIKPIANGVDMDAEM